MGWASLLGGVLLLAAPAHAASVLSVGDGDTITVTEGSRRIKVRLACIDAPETSQSPYGMEARRALQGLLPIGSQVTLRTKTTDRYGRSVAEVVKGSTNINQSLVGAGNAFVYWQYISGCYRQTFSRLENDARLKGAGVVEAPDAPCCPVEAPRVNRQLVGWQIAEHQSDIVLDIKVLLLPYRN